MERALYVEDRHDTTISTLELNCMRYVSHYRGASSSTESGMALSIWFRLTSTRLKLFLNYEDLRMVQKG